MITTLPTNKAPMIRLRAMMFLEFFVLGSTMPIISLYLKSELDFTGTQIGSIMAVSAVSSLFSPVISACIADRIISAERLLSLFHCISALLLLGMRFSTGFISILVFYLLYWLLIGPTTALTTAITFHHAPFAVKNFGGIRLWGTLGWIGAAWTYRFFFSDASTSVSTGNLQGALMMGVYGSVCIGIFALSIPRGLERNRQPIVLFPKDSLKIISHPSLLLFFLFAILISVADRMYMYGGAPFLKSLGFQEKNIMPILSIGQVPEIFGLALLGLFLLRFGIKKALFLGIVFEIMRFLLFACQVSGFPLYAAISLHGLAYAFFFITASIYLDRQCDSTTRSGVHQYFAFIVGGTSNLIGNIIAGYVAEQTFASAAGQTSFTLFWIVPLLLSIAGFFGIVFFFKENNPLAYTRDDRTKK